MEKPGSRLILADEFVTPVVFEPTSPRKMLTTEFVPLTLTSWRLPSSVGWPGFPFGLGGRRVTRVYDLLSTRPATDAVPRFQLGWPRSPAAGNSGRRSDTASPPGRSRGMPRQDLTAD